MPSEAFVSVVPIVSFLGSPPNEKLKLEGAGVVDCDALDVNGFETGGALFAAELKLKAFGLDANGFGVEAGVLPKMPLEAEAPNWCTGSELCGGGRFLRLASSPVGSNRWPDPLDSFSDCSGDGFPKKVCCGGGGKESDGPAGAAKLKPVLADWVFPNIEAPAPNDMDCCGT